MSDSDNSAPAPAIGPWAASTIAAPDVDAVEKTYTDHLGYWVVERGAVSEAQGRSWAAPATIGKKMSLLAPESGKEVLLRIVENERPAAYKPLTSYGWAASELCVQDTDALQERLANTPFKIIGPAADLEMLPAIRAMQVVGLAGEVFYLTMFKEDIPEFDLPTAHSFIDRMFIAVLATDGPEKVQNWYHKHFGIEPGEIAEIKLTLLDDAFGLAEREGDYGLTVVTMRARSLVEVDRYPPQAVERPVAPGALPPGNAMMSVLVDSLDTIDVDYLADPVILPGAPYHGRRSATLKGAMGELLEFIEREAA